jgi:nitrilase
VKLTLAAAICWENYMPLLRHSLYSQNVNLYFAPTADARDTWLSLMRTVACEGRCFVLSANQCVREKDLPDWIYGKAAEEDSAEIEDRNKRRHRRRSVVTEYGNEIALPVDEKDDMEEVIIGGEEKMDDKLHRRKPSIVTEHGHEIIIPAVGEKQSLRRTVSGGEDNINSTGRPRRASFVTEAGHEIALPSDGSKYYAARAVGDGDEDMNDTGHSRKESFVTEDGHEIICPSIGKGKPGQVVNGHGFRKTQLRENKTGSAGSSEFACRGGSCIISPTGDVLAGPLWEEEDELLIVDVDFDDCLRGRLDLDVAGSYSRSVSALSCHSTLTDCVSRNDAFKLTVEGLDINPPL